MIIASSEQDLDAATAAIESNAPQNGHVAGQDGNVAETSNAGNGHVAGASNAAALHAATQLPAHERWQMAADVHDLIMQDLSLALANARALSDDSASASRAV